MASMSAVLPQMYTQSTVRTLLRPVALCALLLVGAAPAATLACELACAAPGGHAGHHGSQQASHHDHSSASVHESSATADGASIVSLAADCDHDMAVAPALTSSAIKVFAHVAITATLVTPADRRSDLIPVRDVAGGPPGTRSRPLSLRI